METNGANCYLPKVFYQHHWAVFQPYWLLLSLLNFPLAAHFTSGGQRKTTRENTSLVSARMKWTHVTAAACWQVNAQRRILLSRAAVLTAWWPGEPANWVGALYHLDRWFPIFFFFFPYHQVATQSYATALKFIPRKYKRQPVENHWFKLYSLKVRWLPSPLGSWSCKITMGFGGLFVICRRGLVDGKSRGKWSRRCVVWKIIFQRGRGWIENVQNCNNRVCCFSFSCLSLYGI